MLKKLRLDKVGNVLNPLRNVKLRTKMTVGFLIIIVFTALLGHSSASAFDRMGTEVTRLDQSVVPGAVSLLNLKATFGSLFKELEGYLTLGDEESYEALSGYILAIQTSTADYTEAEASLGDAQYEAAYQIEYQSAYILSVAQRVVETGQDLDQLQADVRDLRTMLYQESSELTDMLTAEIDSKALEYSDIKTDLANSDLLDGSTNTEFEYLTDKVVPFQVLLLETDSAIGNILQEADQAAGMGDISMVAERVDQYRGQIQSNTTELQSLALEMGEDEVSLAEDIAARADDILDLTQQYLDSIFPLASKEAEHRGLKVEMYNEAKVLGDQLDVHVAGHLDEVDGTIEVVSDVQSSGRQTILIIGFGALAAAVLLRFVVVQDILRSIGRISQTCSEVGMGNFAARSEVLSRDELGEMSDTLNAMLDNTLGLIQTREERDAMQDSIQKLLREVSGVADGDLTVEAEVTADITGAIADSFNLMIGQLRQIITGVQEATQKVSASANEIQASTERLSQGSESQALQIAETSGAIEDMATSIAQVSESATVTASVGEQSLVNAQQGTLAVENTMEGMNRIRDRVQETAKRIKRLGESSQEIGEIVELISDIADRTSILSLNASIQAAMAGEAGQGFAVVAEEVERLADRALQATQQIETLIRTIQTETNEAVAAMEATTNEVVSGTKLAEEAGRALNEIESVSMRLAELSQSISQASQQQARGSEDLARSMSDIAEITQLTAEGTKQAANSISSLAGLADELRVSVSAFKLPGGNTRELG